MRRSLSAAAVAMVGFGLSTGTAAAHVVTPVGPYVLTVGFGEEPPYAGSKNSVQVLVADARGPVTDLAGSLHAEVRFAKASKRFPIEPNFDTEEGFGTPGDYRAWFIPTAPGRYTFHLFGKIHGQRVDRTFSSSPTTFDDVVDPGSVEFPDQPPTNAQLGQLLARLRPRVDEALDSANRAGSSIGSLRSSTDSARTLGIAGIAVGAAGLALAALALFRWTRGARDAAAGS
jgi:hypothetical protein